MTVALGGDAAPTAGGLPVAQAIAVDCGGLTPVAVEVFVTRATALATNAAGLMVSIGISDFTRTRCAAAMSETGNLSATTDTGHQGANDARIIRILDTATEAVVGEASIAAPSADAINLSWTTLPPAGYFVGVRAYYGADCEAFVVSYTGATSDGGTTTVTGVPFRPRFLRAIHRQNGFGTAGAADAKFGSGSCAINEAGSIVGQHCISYAAADRPVAVTACTLVASATKFAIRLGISVAGVTQAAVHEITSGTSDGFVATVTEPNSPATPTALVVGVLCLRYGLRRTWAGEATGLDATSATEQEFADPGFPPACVFVAALSHNALDDYALKSASWSSGVSARNGSSPPEMAYASVQDESGAATADSRARVDAGTGPSAVAFHVLDDAGGIDWAGGIPELTQTGFKVRVDTAAGGARRAFFAAIERPLAAITGPSPQVRRKPPAQAPTIPRGFPSGGSQPQAFLSPAAPTRSVSKVPAALGQPLVQHGPGGRAQRVGTTKPNAPAPQARAGRGHVLVQHGPGGRVRRVGLAVLRAFVRQRDALMRRLAAASRRPLPPPEPPEPDRVTASPKARIFSPGLIRGRIASHLRDR